MKTTAVCTHRDRCRRRLLSAFPPRGSSDGKCAKEVGGFGEVQAVRHRQTGAKYAMKTIPLSRVKDKAAFEFVMKEVDLLKSLDHPNIVRLQVLCMILRHTKTSALAVLTVFSRPLLCANACHIVVACLFSAAFYFRTFPVNIHYLTGAAVGLLWCTLGEHATVGESHVFLFFAPSSCCFACFAFLGSRN